MASSSSPLLLSSRLSFPPSSFASTPSAASSSTASSLCSSNCTSNSAAAAAIPLRKTSAAAAAVAACSRSWARTTGCDVREGGHRGYTKKFNGAPVSVTRVSSARTTRRRGSSTGNRGVTASPRSALVQKVTANELDSILSAERTSPMIIDFYATWCGPCVVLAQELERLAEEYGEDVRFLKVDTDEEHELASQMEIRGLPTMVFVSKDVDKLAIRTEGLLPTNAIRDIIEKEILV